jgi:hypothetical protein
MPPSVQIVPEASKCSAQALDGAQLAMHDAMNDQLSRPVKFLSPACFWQPASFSFSLAHSTFALFHFSTVQLVASSILEVKGDEAFDVCGSFCAATPDIVRMSAVAATSTARTNRMVLSPDAGFHGVKVQECGKERALTLRSTVQPVGLVRSGLLCDARNLQRRLSREATAS